MRQYTVKFVCTKTGTMDIIAKSQQAAEDAVLKRVTDEGCKGLHISKLTRECRVIYG